MKFLVFSCEFLEGKNPFAFLLKTKNSKLKTDQGFTLIELLVVIAIIGILSSIVLASLSGARAKGRDARRISDVKQIQLALELYYDANQKYPTTIGTQASSVLVSNGYISVLPIDPSTSAVYYYSPYTPTTNPGTCTSYHLGATFEVSSNSAFSTDSDITTLTPNTGETAVSGYAVCINGNPDFHGVDPVYDVRP